MDEMMDDRVENDVGRDLPLPTAVSLWPPYWLKGVVRQPAGRLALRLFGVAILFALFPFASLIWTWAQVAQPEVDTAVSLPPSLPEQWCLVGDFQDWDNTSLIMEPLGDGRYALSYTFTEPGRYVWQVSACGNWEVVYPPDTSWVYVSQPDQTIRFTFDTADTAADDFFPSRLVVNANDGLTAFTAVGDFQKWDIESAATRLEPAGNGRYRLRYQVAKPGTYTGLIVAAGTWDGFAVDGRSQSWQTFQFTTTRRSEYVLFMLDYENGRSSIRYGVSPWLGWLAFSPFRFILSALLALLALLVGIAGMNAYFQRYVPWWPNSGCPQCGEDTLKRVRRHLADRLLNTIGVPVRRYTCTTCGWIGWRMKRKIERKHRTRHSAKD